MSQVETGENIVIRRPCLLPSAGVHQAHLLCDRTGFDDEGLILKLYVEILIVIARLYLLVNTPVHLYTHISYTAAVTKASVRSAGAVVYMVVPPPAQHPILLR